MFNLHPKHEPEWEIAEYKEIEQVPVYFENSGTSEDAKPRVASTHSSSVEVQIASILSEDISQVYVFDAPPRSKGKQPATTPPRTPVKRLSLCPSTSSRKFRLRLPRSSSSSSSTTTSSSGSDSEDSASWAAPKMPVSDDGFTLSQTKAALMFARAQLLESPELQKHGVNFLVSEGSVSSAYTLPNR